MKRLIKIGFALVLFAMLFWFSSDAAPSAQARCLADGDLYCPPLWTPVMQAQKDREGFLDARIATAREGLQIGTCDAQCIAAYDQTTYGVLGVLARVNNLPRDKVVLAYIVTWDRRAAMADKLLGAGWWDRGEVFAPWINDFADELRVNHPFAVWGGDNKQWCIVEQYGGRCRGKW